MVNLVNAIALLVMSVLCWKDSFNLRIMWFCRMLRLTVEGWHFKSYFGYGNSLSY